MQTPSGGSAYETIVNISILYVNEYKIMHMYRQSLLGLLNAQQPTRYTTVVRTVCSHGPHNDHTHNTVTRSGGHWLYVSRSRPLHRASPDINNNVLALSRGHRPQRTVSQRGRSRKPGTAGWPFSH